MAKQRKQIILNKPIVTPVKEVTPISEPVIAEPLPVVPQKIVLHFTKPIEVTINARQYFGQDVEVPSYEVAAEIVRIAREAYGTDIL